MRAEQILANRRAKQLEYYHRVKDDPEFKKKRAERDRLRYEKRKAEKVKEQSE